MKEKLTIRERVQALRPGQVIWPLVIILVLLGVGLGIYNYQQNIIANKVPTVTVSKPADNTTVTDSQVSFTGTVDKGDKLTINNKNIPVDADGNFAAKLNLAAGANHLTVVATGANGKSYIMTRQITREVPTAVVATTTGQVAGASTSAQSLAASGPETNYVLSAALMAAALVGWAMSRQNLSKALARR